MAEPVPLHGAGTPAQVVPAGAVRVKRSFVLAPPVEFIVTRYVIASRVRTIPFVADASPPGSSFGVNGPLPSFATSSAIAIVLATDAAVDGAAVGASSEGAVSLGDEDEDEDGDGVVADDVASEAGASLSLPASAGSVEGAEGDCWGELDAAVASSSAGGVDAIAAAAGASSAIVRPRARAGRRAALLIRVLRMKVSMRCRWGSPLGGPEQDLV